MLAALEVEGYRSVRSLRLALGALNVIVGANGCGKTNLYRALHLVSEAAAGRLARALAAEGGMPSVLWAGPRRKKEPVRLRVAVALDEFRYELALGLPVSTGLGKFALDPEVKEERIEFRDVTILERKGGSAFVRDEAGRRVTFPFAITQSESILSELREPQRFPHVAALRELFAGWRFYHGFRLDPESPIRQAHTGVFTPVLSNDGHDLAAALETIRVTGHTDVLDAAIERAFPGSQLEIEGGVEPFALYLRAPDLPRRFSARELSDGTLKYLCIAALLLSPRPPALLALNEPETSIHEDLLEPLAELLVRASERAQLWVTTHSRRLADAVARLSRVEPLALEKVRGETRLSS